MTVDYRPSRGIVPAAICVAFGALWLSPSPAHADDYVLANSKTHKLQVLADGGAAWCSPALRLRMVLDADSPDSGNAASQMEIMSRLKTPIATDCKTAESAIVSVIDRGKTTGTFAATAKGGWQFAALPAPPTVPPIEQKADEVKPIVPPVAAPAPAPTPTPTIAQTPAQTSAPAAPTIMMPKEKGYIGLLLRILKDNPALAAEEATIKFWAAYKFNREYSQVQFQEFKLQPLLARAKDDLSQTISSLPQADYERGVAIFNTSFDAYNFQKQVFPITLNFDQVTFNTPHYIQSSLPSTIALKVPDLDAIAGIPMDPTAAQAFTERRTRWNSVNRSVSIAVVIKIDPSGFHRDGWGYQAALGTVESATFFTDNELREQIFQIGPDEFAKWRQAKAEEKVAAAAAAAQREAELRRQQMLAMREQYIRQIGTASTSVKLANFANDGPLNFYAPLNNLRAARAAALISGKPVAVTMLVQAGSSGRSTIDTSFPGSLQVTVMDGQPDLKSSEWYLVRGLLSVPDSAGTLAAQLTTQAVYPCQQPKCAEAQDPAVIVDRKLAALQGGAQ